MGRGSPHSRDMMWHLLFIVYMAAAASAGDPLMDPLRCDSACGQHAGDCARAACAACAECESQECLHFGQSDAHNRADCKDFCEGAGKSMCSRCACASCDVCDTKDAALAAARRGCIGEWWYVAAA